MPRASQKDIEAARSLVRIRDGHYCQMCGRSIVDQPSALHHRKRKGMGGSALLESPQNLIRLCGLDNATGCHGRAHGNPVWARDNGWMLWRIQDPLDVPVNTFHGLVYLTGDGTYDLREAV